MSDDLVKLLRRPYGNPTFGEKKAIADRIRELEAENARLREALSGLDSLTAPQSKRRLK